MRTGDSMTIEEARQDGNLVKVPIPEGNESTYVKVFREQSAEIQRKRGTLDNSEQSKGE
jgi:hypothetical protein